MTSTASGFLKGSLEKSVAGILYLRRSLFRGSPGAIRYPVFRQSPESGC